jgi:hypothetical protein
VPSKETGSFKLILEQHTVLGYKPIFEIIGILFEPRKSRLGPESPICVRASTDCADRSVIGSGASRPLVACTGSLTSTTMRILTNNYQECELLNLGFNRNGRGPYVVRQDGVPPASLHAHQDPFCCARTAPGSLANCVHTIGKGTRAAVYFSRCCRIVRNCGKAFWKACCGGHITSREESRGASGY